MKIATVVGARPQFIKAAAVSRVMRLQPELQEVLIHTGQHYDANMSEVFFTELEIPRSAYHLGVGDLPHGAMTGRMLERIEQVLTEERPTWVLVYGDTNSTLAGALAAAKLNIPVAHVEAGLRSFNLRMPEEINRVVTDHVARALFAPTDIAVANLLREGIGEDKIRKAGDVMFDAALFYADKAQRVSTILRDLKLGKKDYIVATIHREENVSDEDRLATIFNALVALSAEIRVVIPLHPRSRDQLSRAGLLDTVAKHLTAIEPVGYLDMVMLEKNAKAVVTDSGGIQKEAFFYGVPCVTLRGETEWVELVEAGWNTLVAPKDSGSIESRIREILRRDNVPEVPSALYGNGDAAQKIVAYFR